MNIPAGPSAVVIIIVIASAIVVFRRAVVLVVVALLLASLIAGVMAIGRNLVQTTSAATVTAAGTPGRTLIE